MYGGWLLCAFGLEAERLTALAPAFGSSASPRRICFSVDERWGTDQGREKISEVAGEENRRFWRRSVRGFSWNPFNLNGSTPLV